MVVPIKFCRHKFLIFIINMTLYSNLKKKKQIRSTSAEKEKKGGDPGSGA